MSLVCFKEGCNDIVGMNVLFVVAKDKKEEPPHKVSKHMQQIILNFPHFPHYI
jgi:GNAT superfamily N-acetyltransferase